MSELPRFEITLGGEDFEATPENCTLFTHLGTTALNGIEMENSRFDHVYFQRGMVDDDTMTGSYVFRTEKTAEVYDQIVEYIIALGFPMVLNRREIAACDVEAYFRLLEQLASSEGVDDFVPDDWN